MSHASTLLIFSWSCASPWRGPSTLRGECFAVQRPSAEDADIVAARTRFRNDRGQRRRTDGERGAYRRPFSVVRNWDNKKGAAVAGGSKVKQGGVKQSGQEPLDVQKLDDHSNGRESLTTR